MTIDYERMGETMNCPLCNSIMYLDQSQFSDPSFRCPCGNVIWALTDTESIECD